MRVENVNTNIRWTPSPSLLSKKLWTYRQKNAVLATTSAHARPLAEALQRDLDLDMYDHYCSAIAHPGRAGKTIGSVTANEVVLHGTQDSMPQDYIEHQIAMTQHDLRRHESGIRPTLRGKIVIVVSDSVKRADSVLATIEELKKNDIDRLIVATSTIGRDALSILADVADDVVYGAACSEYSWLPSPVSERQTKRICGYEAITILHTEHISL